MKIPFRPISESEYAKRLDALVAKFERDIAATYQINCRRERENDSLYALAWRRLRDHGPMTASEACEGLLLPHDRIGPLMESLVFRGWARKFDQVERTWRGGRGVPATHKVWRFDAVTDGGPQKQVTRENLARRFIADIEKLEARRMVATCLTQRIERNMNFGDARYPNAEWQRNQDIVARRVDGDDLQAIGADYGITRERVRQIVERAAFKQVNK